MNDNPMTSMIFDSSDSEPTLTEISVTLFLPGVVLSALGVEIAKKVMPHHLSQRTRPPLPAPGIVQGTRHFPDDPGSECIIAFC